MIFMHGSGGGFTNAGREKIDPWLKMFNKMGIATFKLNSFSGRGVTTTVGKQHAVTTAEMVVDVYMALDLLSKHPRIDPNRIGLIGCSKGGIVTLFSYWKPIRDAIGTEAQLACHISLYGMPMDFENFEFTGVPFLALVGEKDDWVASEPWNDLIKKFKEKGYDAEVVIYKGAHHSFDAGYEVQKITNAHSYSKCRYLIEADGDMIELTSGLNAMTDTSATDQCRERTSVTIGKNYKAKKASKEKTKEFVSRVFGNS